MLYDVERMADDHGMDTIQRIELRKRLAYPIIRAFEKWCICEQSKVLPKSPIGKAIGYFLNYSRQLVRYTMDGRYMLDNNLIENSVRPVALGCKNYRKHPIKYTLYFHKIENSISTLVKS